MPLNFAISFISNKKLIKMKIEGRFNARAYQIELRDEFMFTEHSTGKEATASSAEHF